MDIYSSDIALSEKTVSQTDSTSTSLPKQGNDVGLDVTRIIAFMSVPAIHFFLNSGFYSTPVDGERMYLMVIMRTLFMICVPLFMLMSGYLMANKKSS